MLSHFFPIFGEDNLTLPGKGVFSGEFAQNQNFGSALKCDLDSVLCRTTFRWGFGGYKGYLAGTTRLFLSEE
jgi:hypothetical protein